MADATNDDGPVPLSFPAILRNPGISHKLAYLRDDSNCVPSAPVYLNGKRDDNEGKRWIRRKENSRFYGNPHIVAATKADHTAPPPTTRSTFPQPLPTYLSRSTHVPSLAAPARDPSSANAGRFSLSLRGMRRELRRAGARAEQLVRDIEEVLVRWLWTDGTVLYPDVVTPVSVEDDEEGLTTIGETKCIREVSRSPLQLVWFIADDPFARYVVHCVARYHEIVSYSKEVHSRRLTYLLRPNVTRPDFRASACLYTPPITDLDSSVHSDSASDIDCDSDTSPSAAMVHALVSISEDSELPRPTAVSDAGIEDDEETKEIPAHGLSRHMESLSLHELRSDAEPTSSDVLESGTRPRVTNLVRPRSSSSPSPSPVRLKHRRARPGIRPRPRPASQQSFYSYLFS